jgi:hypothetical protein
MVTSVIARPVATNVATIKSHTDGRLQRFDERRTSNGLRRRQAVPYNFAREGLWTSRYQSQTDGFWRFAAPFSFSRYF